jgi:hypothetical protein
MEAGVWGEDRVERPGEADGLSAEASAPTGGRLEPISSGGQVFDAHGGSDLVSRAACAQRLQVGDDV